VTSGAVRWEAPPPNSIKEIQTATPNQIYGQAPQFSTQITPRAGKMPASNVDGASGQRTRDGRCYGVYVLLTPEGQQYSDLPKAPLSVSSARRLDRSTPSVA